MASHVANYTHARSSPWSCELIPSQLANLSDRRIRAHRLHKHQQVSRVVQLIRSSRRSALHWRNWMSISLHHLPVSKPSWSSSGPTPAGTASQPHKATTGHSFHELKPRLSHRAVLCPTRCPQARPDQTARKGSDCARISRPAPQQPDKMEPRKVASLHRQGPNQAHPSARLRLKEDDPAKTLNCFLTIPSKKPWLAWQMQKDLDLPPERR